MHKVGAGIADMGVLGWVVWNPFIRAIVFWILFLLIMIGLDAASTWLDLGLIFQRFGLGIDLLRGQIADDAAAKDALNKLSQLDFIFSLILNQLLSVFPAGHNHIKHMVRLLTVFGNERELNFIVKSPIFKMIIIIVPYIFSMILNVLFLLKLSIKKCSENIGR